MVWLILIEYIFLLFCLIFVKKIYYFSSASVTEEKHNSAQRKQKEPGAGVVMKRSLSTSFLEYEEKLHLHNSEKNHAYNQSRKNVFTLNVPCPARVSEKLDLRPA